MAKKTYAQLEAELAETQDQLADVEDELAETQDTLDTIADIVSGDETDDENGD
jgi:septal ring factor EnvC (AmiA/AmiB activator)